MPVLAGYWMQDAGQGKYLPLLASVFDEAYGIDLSEEMLEVSEDRAADREDIAVEKMDIRDLEFPDNYFDGVYTNTALVHLNKDDKRRAIDEFSRVLVDGGVLYTGVQNLLSFPNTVYLKDALITPPWEKEEIGHGIHDQKHWYYTTRPQMTGILEKNGFEVIDTNSAVARWLDIYSVNQEG